MAQILAYDLGGSSLRLALVAQDGRFLAALRKPLTIESPDTIRFDIDPEIWWQAFQDGCQEFAEQGHDFSGIKAVAGCGFTRTQVFVDADQDVVCPAIPFQDARAASVLGALRSAPPSPTRDLIEGLGPYDPLARLLWLKETAPDALVRVHRVIEPKDFLNLRLTGVPATDIISQSATLRPLNGNPQALRTLGFDPAILPMPKAPFDVVGAVQSGLAGPLAKLAGVPVYCGSMDTWACVLGSGALAPGVAYCISGTSDVSGLMTTQRAEAPGLLTVEWGPGLWQIGGPSQGAATRLKWALDHLCQKATDAPKTCLETALNGEGDAPLFLPFLDGERTPLWDADLRGAFLGLSMRHGAGDLLRAVAEGMNYLSKDVLTRAETASGDRAVHVRFSGGLANDPALCQLKADVLDRRIVVPENPETGLMGAARIAGGASVQPLMHEAVRTYHPNQSRRSYHMDRFEIFCQAVTETASLSHRMADMQRKANSETGAVGSAF